MRWFPFALAALAAGCDLPATSPSTQPVLVKGADPKPGPKDPDKADDRKPSDLPPVPQADPKSTLTVLNKEKTLYLEKLPDKSMRVLVAAEVCLREGLLEVLLCKKNTKEHESILRVDMDARFLHATLVASGAKHGKPVQFINDKGDPDYKPASGDKIAVSVHYTLDGKTHTHAAQEWILDKKTKKPMAHQWVFAGSRFVKNPDAPDPNAEYYTANNGEVIGLSNFVDSMLDLPVEISRDNADLNFDAITEKIPPLGSKVWVILKLIPGPA